MIKEALQYIASLKEEAMGIITEEINLDEDSVSIVG